MLHRKRPAAVAAARAGVGLPLEAQAGAVLRAGDLVEVVAGGRDEGRRGRVLGHVPRLNAVLVEGVGMVGLLLCVLP